MFTRRTNSRQRRECGSANAIGATGAPFTPLSITSATLIAYYRADSVLLGTGVSTWPDQGPVARHIVQAVGANQPAWSASDAAFGGQASVTFDGVNDRLSNTTDFPWAAVGASFRPYFFGIMRHVTWVLNATPWTTNNLGTGYELIPQLVTPQMAMFATGGSVVNNNSGVAVGSAGLAECNFTNTAADFLRWGPSTITGAAAGAGAATTILHLGFNGAGTAFCNVAYAECGWWETLPTPADRAALQAYAVARYPGLIV